ncbi:MAG: M48 family metalloprotease [Pseudomonadota bacterium]
MTLSTLRVLARAALLLALAVLTGCETSPATGRTFFSGGMSAEDEAKLGAEQHGKVQQQFGGPYDDPALSAYVTSLGNFLAETSELPDLEFTFTVLDSPIINAFALPGGYVYVTRGLVALADNEAELAGVMAHEIGHVTARHSAERYGQAVGAQVLAGAVGLVFGGGAETQAVQGVSVLALKSWSRDQEFEADLLGVRYLTRAGFDPQAMAGFLEALQAHARLEAEIAGRPGAADEFSLLQTHPRTTDRIEVAMKQAGIQAVPDPIVGRDIYLKKIDGIVYGDSPENGFVRGQRFLHPVLRLAFEVPQGFRLINSQSQVLALGPEGAGIAFNLAPKSQGIAPRDYLTQVWAKNISLQNVENININGMAAATGQARISTRGGAKDARLVVVRYDNTYMYRFLFLTNPSQTPGLAEAFKRTTYSFRKLSAAEAAEIKPMRLRIHQVQAGETAASIAERFPFDSFRLERFLVLNGFDRNVAVSPGQQVKIITQ